MISCNIGLGKLAKISTGLEVDVHRNTVNWYFDQDNLINTSDPDERQLIIDAIRRGSVIAWSHVNLRGEYSFTAPSANDDVFDFEKIKALQIN